LPKVSGLELEAVDYITKPFQQEEVARVKLHLSLSQLNCSLQERIEEQSRTEAQLQQSTEQLEQRVHERASNLTPLL
jgi:DNA-binding response OmpR family regulator